MMDSFKITYDSLQVDEVRRTIADDTLGAHVLFCGTVRNSNKGEQVTHLEFEAYEGMVIKELERIAADLRFEFAIEYVALHHRLGAVHVGEDAVIAAVSAKHRDVAFAACEQLMHRLKAHVPIWKKEFISSGAVWVTPTP